MLQCRETVAGGEFCDHIGLTGPDLEKNPSVSFYESFEVRNAVRHC